MRGRTNTLFTLKINFVKILPNGCWFWKGAIGSSGYGQANLNKKHWHVHRLFWTLIKGPIEANQQIHHTCGCKLCVNPEHMTLMSISEHGTLSNKIRYSK